MWDHSRSITHVLPGLRSVGICAMHGMDNHICSMYTASEDRSIKLWNITRFKAYKTIQSKSYVFVLLFYLFQSAFLSALFHVS